MVSAIVFLLCSRASRVGFLGALCCREHGHECKLSARGRQRSFKLFFKLQEEGGGSEVLAFNFYYTNCPAPIQFMVHTWWWWLTMVVCRGQRLSATAVLLPSNVFVFVSFLIHFCCIFLHLWTDRFYMIVDVPRHGDIKCRRSGLGLCWALLLTMAYRVLSPHSIFITMTAQYQEWKHYIEQFTRPLQNIMASFDSQCFVGQM